MAGRVYLANAFSLSMLGMGKGYAGLCVEEMDADRWALHVNGARLSGELECVIGHEATVRLVEKLLEMDEYAWGNDSPNVKLRCGRRAVKLEPGDILYVVQPRIRLPEGKILDYKEIVDLLRQDRIGFYAVHHGPC
ncbi:MAG: DUF1874 domain-containing protein [Desulfurococcales archaeon]|nr:DUF1874 domain-containing protein [Desulfurococcales archaeon]